MRQTLSMDPNYMLGHLNVGLIYAAQGSYDEAVTAFRRASQYLSGVRRRHRTAWVHVPLAPATSQTPVRSASNSRSSRATPMSQDTFARFTTSVSASAIRPSCTCSAPMTTAAGWSRC